MAKLSVFAVYDSKVQAFASPFFMRAKGEAVRAFQEAVNDPSTSLCKYPEDFSLMELGEYDESTGQFSNCTAPINLGLAAQFKRPPAENMSLPFKPSAVVSADASANGAM